MSEHKAGDATQAHAILAELREQMANAYHHGQPLYLQGGNTCRFYGHPVAGMPGTPKGSPVAAGQPLLSMHSQREMCGVADGPRLSRAMRAFWLGA